MKNAPLRRRSAQMCDHTYRSDRFRIARWLSEAQRPSRPLLFFSGFGANIELLAPFLEQLRGRDVVMLDILGLGGSSESRRPYRLSTMADAAARIVADLGYEAVDVMGVSWGGMLAQEYAYRQRRTVRRLVLAATSPGMPMIPGNVSSLIKMVLPHRYSASGAIDTFLHSLYGGSSDGLDDYASRVRAPTPRGYLHQLLAITGWTSLRKLTRLSAETLILMGAQDRLVPPANGQILKFLLKDARLEVLEGAGHLFLLTHRDIAASRIETFLDRPAADRSALQFSKVGIPAPAGPATR